jgi:acyl-coenzyme A thioesterase PaaI-like protein
MTRAQTAADTTLLAALVLALLIRTQTVQLRLRRLESCRQRRFLGIGDGEHIEAVRRQAEFW